jgi:hypothetical protein
MADAKEKKRNGNRPRPCPSGRRRRKKINERAAPTVGLGGEHAQADLTAGKPGDREGARRSGGRRIAVVRIGGIEPGKANLPGVREREVKPIVDGNDGRALLRAGVAAGGGGMNLAEEEQEGGQDGG